jgi:hypothetical protein
MRKGRRRKWRRREGGRNEGRKEGREGGREEAENNFELLNVKEKMMITSRMPSSEMWCCVAESNN